MSLDNGVIKTTSVHSVNNTDSTLNNKKSSLKNKCIIGSILGLACITYGGLNLYTNDTGKLPDGIVYSGVSVGNISVSAAEEQVKKIDEGILNNSITLTSNNKAYSISLKDLGLSINQKVSIPDIYSLDKQGSIINKAMTKYEMNKHYVVEPVLVWDETILKDALNKQLASLNVPVQDAKLSISESNSIVASSEKEGSQIDVADLASKIKSEDITKLKGIEIPFTIVKPTVLKADLEKQKPVDVISTYTTHFNPAQQERTENVKLATQALDGTLIKPGDTFSFNGTVGERTADKGYESALIIVDDKFVPGLGGGVCQVSSTLYNAVRETNLKVVERTKHSLPVTYVPAGQDATVAYPYVDFKFKNTTNNYVLLRSHVDGSSLTFTLYGKK